MWVNRIDKIGILTCTDALAGGRPAGMVDGELVEGAPIVSRGEGVTCVTSGVTNVAGATSGSLIS